MMTVDTLSMNSNQVARYKDEFFGDLAIIEDRHFWFRGRNILIEYIIKQLSQTSLSILEIGTGTGIVSVAMRKAAPNSFIIASELSKIGIQFARRRDLADAYVQMDARNIATTDVFDLVVCCDVLEHIENDRCVLHEIYRTLKFGGACIVSVPQHKWLWSKMDEEACHVRRYERDALVKVVQQAGFTVEWISSFNMMLSLALFIRNVFCVPDQMRRGASGMLEVSRLLNKICENILKWEHSVVRYNVSLPFGSSLFLVAKKI